MHGADGCFGSTFRMAALYNFTPFATIFTAGRSQQRCNGGFSEKIAKPEVVDDQSSQSGDGLSSSKPHLFLVCDALRDLAQTYTSPSALLRSSRGSPVSYSAGRITLRQRARKARLVQDLAAATTYKEKRRLHKELYQLESDDEIDTQRRASLFDAELVKSHIGRLETDLHTDDVHDMLLIVKHDLTRDLGGMCNPALFHHFGVKTEPLVDRYQKAVQAALRRLVDVCRLEDQRIEPQEVLQVLNGTCQ